MKIPLKFRTLLFLLLLCFLCGCGTGTAGSEQNTAVIPDTSAEPAESVPEEITTDAESIHGSTTETPAVLTEAYNETSVNSEGTAAVIPTDTTRPVIHEVTQAPKTGTVRIGLSGMDDSQDLGNYVTAVKKAGCEPVILKYVSNAGEARALLDTVDALIMTGGEDIDPKWYGESKLNSSIKINQTRDTSDILLICEAIARNMPTLCICRGMQILNVACGGSLYQDIPSQIKGALTHRDRNLSAWKYHEITTEPDSLVNSILGNTYSVNSWHHQSVKNPGSNIRITARTSDGVVEAIELTGKTFIVGVQFHPEYFTAMGDKTFLKFFTALVNAAS